MSSPQLLEILAGKVILVLGGTLIASIILTGVTWYPLRKTGYYHLVCGVVPLAFVIGYILLLGPPPLSIFDPLHFLPYVCLLAMVIGVSIDYFTNVDKLRLAVILVWPGILVLLIGWREMPDFPTFAGVPMAALWLACVITNIWFTNPQRFRMVIPVCLLAVSIGLGIDAWAAGGKILPMLDGAMAAALIGFIGWNYPTPKVLFLGSGVIGVGGMVLAVAITEALYSNAAPEAIAVLLLVIVAPFVSSRLPKANDPKMGPIMLLLVCLVPVVISTALALRAAGNVSAIPSDSLAAPADTDPDTNATAPTDTPQQN